MRLIAIEEHVLPPFVREAWAAAPEPHDPVSEVADGGDNGTRLADLGADRLALMDEQGVDVQVLSLTTPGRARVTPSVFRASLPCQLQTPTRRLRSWNGPFASSA